MTNSKSACDCDPYISPMDCKCKKCHPQPAEKKCEHNWVRPSWGSYNRNNNLSECSMCGATKKMGMPVSSESEGGWRDKIREDYAGILSQKWIDMTIGYWENFISEVEKKAYEKGHADNQKKGEAFRKGFSQGYTEGYNRGRAGISKY